MKCREKRIQKRIPELISGVLFIVLFIAKPVSLMSTFSNSYMQLQWCVGTGIGNAFKGSIHIILKPSGVVSIAHEK